MLLIKVITFFREHFDFVCVLNGLNFSIFFKIDLNFLLVYLVSLKLYLRLLLLLDVLNNTVYGIG